MTSSSMSTKDCEFNDLLYFEATESPLSSPLILEGSSLERIVQSSFLIEFPSLLLDATTLGNLDKAARILDILLALSLKDDQSEYTTTFFLTLESVTNQLVLEKLELFWQYFEHRVAFLKQLAQFNNSIILLRICKASLDRINKDLQAHLIGRILQVLATVKGFAHPSRLNKRGKSWIPDSVLTDSFSLEEIILKQSNLGPYEAKQKLGDLPNLQEPLPFFELLLKKLKRSKHQYGTKSFAQILPNTSWAEIDNLGNKLFYIYAWIVLAVLTKNKDLKWSEKVMTDIKQGLRRSEVQFLEEHCFKPEELWSQWKLETCMPVTATPMDPLNNETTIDTKIFQSKLPEMSNIIGNERLTKLLQQQYSFERFAVIPKSEQQFEELRQQLESKTDCIREKEALELKTLRLKSWGNLIEYFASQPKPDQSNINEMEDKVVNEIQNSSAHRPSGTHLESNTATKRSQALLENAAKRPRLSYEDTRYGNRQQAMENTLKPLPY